MIRPVGHLGGVRLRGESGRRFFRIFPLVRETARFEVADLHVDMVENRLEVSRITHGRHFFEPGEVPFLAMLPREQRQEARGTSVVGTENRSL